VNLTRMKQMHQLWRASL